jgi:hypothetical protein
MAISGGAWDTLRSKVLARDMGACHLCHELGADQVDDLVKLPPAAAMRSRISPPAMALAMPGNTASPSGREGGWRRR